MLGSSSSELERSTLLGPGDILDAVGVSVLFHDLLSHEFVDIDMMLVVEIDTGNVMVVLTEGNSSNTSGSLWKLHSGDSLSS